MNTPLHRLRHAVILECDPSCVSIHCEDVAKALAVVKAAKAMMGAPCGTAQDQDAITDLGDALAAIENDTP